MPRLPKRLAVAGGVLISLSGVVNAILGASIGAFGYVVYPGGRLGHVGIIAGIIAVLLGLAILFLAVPLVNRGSRRMAVLGSVLVIVLGHLGAIAGALYVGTAGLLLCYVSGIWLLSAAIRSGRKDKL